jgi:hypothetical protein
MRPIFGDLLSDVQKSINYYQQLHRGATIGEVIGLGSTCKIPGLRTFLEQQLGLKVRRCDELQRIRAEGREAADFAAHAVNMATAYGLALQGIGLAQIDINLAPVKALRDQMWAGKTKWFAAAAALAVVGSVAMFARGTLDRGELQSGDAATTDSLVTSVLAQGRQMKNEYQQLEAAANVGYSAENVRRLTDDRTVWPQLIDDAAAALASAKPQAATLGESAADIAAIPAGQRRLIQLEDLKGEYAFANGSRRITVEMYVNFSNEGRQDFLNETVGEWLRAMEGVARPDVPYTIVKGSVKLNADRLQTLEIDESGVAKGSDSPTQGSPPPTDRGRPSVPAEGAGDSNPGGGFGLGGGGFGKRGVADEGSKLQRPGARGLSGAGAGGSDTPEGGEEAGGAGSPGYGRDNTIRREAGGSGAETSSKFDFATLAPIPAAPSVFKKGDKLHRGVVTFQVELPAVQSAVPQEQPTQ